MKDYDSNFISAKFDREKSKSLSRNRRYKNKNKKQKRMNISKMGVITPFYVQDTKYSYTKVPATYIKISQVPLTYYDEEWGIEWVYGYEERIEEIPYKKRVCCKEEKVKPFLKYSGISGRRKYAKNQTNRRIRRNLKIIDDYELEEFDMNDMDDEYKEMYCDEFGYEYDYVPVTVENEKFSLGNNPGAYRKQFDYWWEVW